MTRNILFSLISIFSLNSQDIEPVEWQYDVNKINDTEYNISLLDEDLNQIKVEIDYSSCDDELCIFRNETFNVILDNSIIVTESENVTLEDVRRYNALELDLDKSNYNSSNFIERSNYFEIFIFGLIAGFLALLTPCVFPMIPLTVSYFIDETKLRYSGAISASLYGGFIVLIYILLSIPFHVFDSLNPNILNTISTNVYVNLTFFVVFIRKGWNYWNLFYVTYTSSCIILVYGSNIRIFISWFTIICSIRGNTTYIWYVWLWSCACFTFYLACLLS